MAKEPTKSAPKYKVIKGFSHKGKPVKLGDDCPKVEKAVMNRLIATGRVALAGSDELKNALAAEEQRLAMAKAASDRAEALGRLPGANGAVK